jgi:hypothetical protein
MIGESMEHGEHAALVSYSGPWADLSIGIWFVITGQRTRNY